MAWEWEEKPLKHSGRQADAQADKSDPLESPSNGCDVGWTNSTIPPAGTPVLYRERIQEQARVRGKENLIRERITLHKWNTVSSQSQRIRVHLLGELSLCLFLSFYEKLLNIRNKECNEWLGLSLTYLYKVHFDILIFLFSFHGLGNLLVAISAGIFLCSADSQWSGLMADLPSPSLTARSRL